MICHTSEFAGSSHKSVGFHRKDFPVTFWFFPKCCKHWRVRKYPTTPTPEATKQIQKHKNKNLENTHKRRHEQKMIHPVNSQPYPSGKNSWGFEFSYYCYWLQESPNSRLPRSSRSIDYKVPLFVNYFSWSRQFYSLHAAFIWHKTSPSKEKALWALLRRCDKGEQYHQRQKIVAWYKASFQKRLRFRRAEFLSVFVFDGSDF